MTVTAILVGLSVTFWALFIYPYLIYPKILGMLSERPIQPRPVKLSVSILFCAHNEIECIAEKIENLRALKRACPDLEILVYDDASTDGTHDMLAGAGDLLRVIRGPGRTGKAAGMKRLVAQSTGKVLVFTDANILLAADLVDRLLPYYGDPDVGGVSGTIKESAQQDSVTSSVGTAYLTLDDRLQMMESRTGNVMGASGGLFSVRRELYPDFPDTVQDDFTVSMSVIFRGKRLIKAPDVVAYEKTVSRREEELTRKVRIGARAFHTHSFLRPQIASMSARDRMKYLSRKMLRWFGGVFLALGALFALAAVATLSKAAAAALAAGALVTIVISLRSSAGFLAKLGEMGLAVFATLFGVLQGMRGRTRRPGLPPNRDERRRWRGPSGDPRGLRISYLFQQFPIPTETFAVSDIAALIAQGHHVSVYTLKLPRKGEKSLSQKCGVPSQLAVFRPSWAGARSWPKLIWRRRGHAAWLIRQILPHWRSAPLLCLQTLLCIPRLLEIADQVGRDGSEVVHAFWSRHVALVLPLLKVAGAPCLRTAFVGAYDLVADDFIFDISAQASEILFSHAEVNRPFLERKAGPDTSIEIVHRGIPLMDEVADGSRDPFRLITASALVESKNVEAVIRSFAGARARESRLTLWIYGDGPDRPRLERLVQQLGCSTSVTFAGHVARDELFLEMQRASVFVLLSKKPSERLPNVLKEALWAGCAVISSDSEGIEELLPDPSIGIVVDPDDAQAIGAALQDLLLQSPEDRQRRRERARAFIAEHFSSAASMRAYVRAWQGRLDVAGVRRKGANQA
jgi:glycosyltransferase involved in cell wall biosynthesis